MTEWRSTDYISPRNPLGEILECSNASPHSHHEYQANFGDYYNVHCPGVKAKPKKSKEEELAEALGLQRVLPWNQLLLEVKERTMGYSA